MRRLLFAVLFLAIPAMVATDASAGGCRIKRGCSACEAPAYGYAPPVSYGVQPVYGYYSNPPVVVVAPAPVVYGFAGPRYYAPYGYGYGEREFDSGYYGYEGRGRGFLGVRW